MKDCVCETHEDQTITTDMMLVKWSLLTGALVTVFFILGWALYVMITWSLRRNRRDQHHSLSTFNGSCFSKKFKTCKPRITFEQHPTSFARESIISDILFPSNPFEKLNGSPRQLRLSRPSTQTENLSLFSSRGKIVVESPLEDVSCISNHYLSQVGLQTLPKSSTPKNPLSSSFSETYPLNTESSPSRM
jgi:hypothetical protein